MHASRAMTINRIQTEARKIEWSVEIPSPPYSHGLIENLNEELAIQSTRHAIMVEAQQVALNVMKWAPSLPSAPYSLKQPREYKTQIETQIEYHETIMGVWRLLGHSGRQLISLPTPPYRSEQVDSFIDKAQPFLDGATARKQLRRNRTKLALALFIFILTPICLWQLSLKSELNRLIAKAESIGLQLPLVDVSCDATHREMGFCETISPPSLPTTPQSIEQFSNALRKNIELKRSMENLRQEALDASIDICNGSHRIMGSTGSSKSTHQQSSKIDDGVIAINVMQKPLGFRQPDGRLRVVNELTQLLASS